MSLLEIDRPAHVDASGGDFPAAQYLQEPDGGMAQYGTSLQQSTSLSNTLQSLSNWNAYIVPRSENGLALSSTLLNRLAAADWNARQGGAPQITASQIASAANQLIANKLATMTAAQQQALFNSMISVSTPKGLFSLNQDNSYVSASQNPNGTWNVTISSAAFADRKAQFAQLAPGMVSSSTNFYPGEVIIVLYSVASSDMGYGTDFLTSTRQTVRDLTGLDLTSTFLFGEHGFFCRRPMATFLTAASMSQFFSSLGF